MRALKRFDRLLDPEGHEFVVLCVHEPYVTARARRKEAVTILRVDEERAYGPIPVEDLEKGGFTQIDRAVRQAA